LPKSPARRSIAVTNLMRSPNFQFRAERKLGEMMKAARDAGALAKGTRGQFAGKSKGSRHSGGVKKPRQNEPALDDAGVDKNLDEGAVSKGFQKTPTALAGKRKAPRLSSEREAPRFALGKVCCFHTFAATA
jgi:hypothetical protein